MLHDFSGFNGELRGSGLRGGLREEDEREKQKDKRKATPVHPASIAESSRPGSEPNWPVVLQPISVTIISFFVTIFSPKGVA
jgi:hypothetical protein